MYRAFEVYEGCEVWEVWDKLGVCVKYGKCECVCVYV